MPLQVTLICPSRKALFLFGSSQLTVLLEGNAKLTSLAGLGPLLSTPGLSDIYVQVIEHPALTSLAGLESITDASLYLKGLPALPNLDPLKKLIDTRNKLRDLLAKADRSEELESLLESVLKSSDDIAKLEQ